MNPKLLLITDRADLARVQAQMLVTSGIEVSLLLAAIVKHQTHPADLEDFDLILINLYEDEPGMWEICRKLRPEYENPILVQIYVRDERALLHLYEAGADDCLVQPMGSHVLLLKIQAWLERAGVKDKTIGLLEVYKFQFDPVKSEVVTPQNNLVRLSLLEARLLHLLMVNSGRIVATDTIIQRVWPDNATADGDRHLLKALVHRLRRKIEQNPTTPQYIHTVPHQGYSFRLKDSHSID
jgi:DNA-binding response OmpR family regulator